MKIYVVCQCGHHADEEATIEINFRDNSVHYVCPECKKENVLNLEPSLKPLPRMNIRR